MIFKLSKLYGKSVELRPVRIHYPYLNSYILAQYLAFNIMKGNSSKIFQNLFKKIKLVKNSNITPTNFRGLIRFSSVLNGPQYLTGLKIQISGRLSQRKAASRTKIVTKSIGNLSLSSFSSSSSMDASKFSFTGKNGTITVKVWLSSCSSNTLVTQITNTPLLQSSHSSNIRDSKTRGIRFYSSNAGNNPINNGTFVPVIVYKNADTDKFIIFTDNKQKTGIYLWTHLGLNNQYIGSAVDLSIR